MRLILLATLLVALTACEPSGRVAKAQRAGGVTDTTDLPATNIYAIETPHGQMVVRLFDDTPLHRDNFKRLVADGVLDSTLFHRVIAGFMIQGGDPNSRDDDPYDDGRGGPGYTVPAEIVSGRYHHRGALAAARTGDAMNPERASSGSQFYLVHGTRFDSLQLAGVEEMIRQTLRDTTFRFTPEQRDVYMREGGAPNLDAQYTVFGELLEGFEVLDRIAMAATARSTGTPAPPPLADRPLEPVPMTVRPLPDYTPPSTP